MDFPELGALNFGWRDVLDIAVATTLFYYAIAMLKQTRAVTAIYGLLLLLVLYLVSLLIGLNTMNWLLEDILSSLFLIVVIIFQRDIRQALSSLGAHRLWLSRFFGRKGDSSYIPLVCGAAVHMAQRKIGALIVIERNVPLGDAAQRGVALDAAISMELLISIFWPNSPLHDGAVIISRGRISAAGCILPLSTAVTKRDYGTRHRAALGITEESDALVVVVSEERGAVAVALDGKLTTALDAVKLPRVILSAMERKL
jgi:uncharacterized protein (TIGR00159 family)